MSNDSDQPETRREREPAAEDSGSEPIYSPPRAEGVPNAPPVVAQMAYTPPPYVEPPLSPSHISNWLVAFLVGIAAPFAAFVVAITVMISVMLLTADSAMLRDVARLQEWTIQFSSTIPGLMVMVVPGQLTFVLIAYGCAKFSREGWVRRLELEMGRVPVITWPIFALATPVIGFAGSMFVGWVLELLQLEMSAHLDNLESVLTSFTGPNLLLLILLVSVLPGFCEEILFRGYVQSRLAKAWPPILAILFSGTCFAFAHMDPMHMAIVFPIGVWLGVIAWKAGSIWPAIFGHVINNVVSIIGSQTESLGISSDLFFRVVMIVSGAALVFSVGLVVALPTRVDPPPPS